MAYERETPFDNIESAQQFVELLAEAIEEARREVEAEMTSPTQQPDRQMQALQLVSYNLSKLSTHIGSSYRILNDLRTLRRLLLRERALEQEPAE